MTRWTPVTKAAPCPACGKPDWCAFSPDGDRLLCKRGGDTPQGMRRLSSVVGGGVLYAIEQYGGNGRTRRLPARKPSESPTTDWKTVIVRLRANMTPERLTALADATGVPADAWAKLLPGWADAADLQSTKASGAGWPDDYPTGAWAFAEVDGHGRVIGLSLRAADGRKGAPAGARRGLIVPPDRRNPSLPTLIVEGASDVAACIALGLPAIGRPSNVAGASALADLLDGMSALVVGENDTKPDGAWPGRDGAKSVAGAIAKAWGQPVRWTLPPVGAKDVREWLRARIADGLAMSDPNAAQAAGHDLLTAMESEAREQKADRRNMADLLVDLATERYRLGVSDSGEAFAVAHDGPAAALLFRGGASSLRATLAREYRAVTGRTPNASALADALLALEGMAQDATPEPLALRVADHDGGVVIELGDKAGRAVVVHPGGWEVVDRSPVLFRRSALTSPMPEPVRGGDLNLLRDLLNVDADTWPLLVGYMVAALLPNIPHPILLFGGMQGTGKSTAARIVVNTIDASAAPLRSEPREPEQWALSAAGSWAVCIDNISSISVWWSDALCKSVTGDGWLRRKLYTDGDLSVVSFRRVILLTSIDAGAVRGDLGDRLVLVDLLPIAESNRRTETDIDALLADRQPAILGALLDLLAAVLTKLPDVKLSTMPRMADFARVLAAVDMVRRDGSDGSECRALDIYLRQRGRIADEVVEGDPVGAAIVRLVEQVTAWTGTTGELLTTLTPTATKPPHGWPASPRALAGRLKRLTPALRAVGVCVTSGDTRSARGRVIVIERVATQQSLPSQQSFAGENKPTTSDGRSDGSDVVAPDSHTDRYEETGDFGPETPVSDGSDGSDGLYDTLSPEIVRYRV